MKKLLTYFFAVALMLSAFSCKDDEVDCSGNESKLMSYSDAYDDALDAQDCEQIEAIAAKQIALARKSKSCSFVKEFLEDEGYDNIEEYLEEYQFEVESDLADAGC